MFPHRKPHNLELEAPQEEAHANTKGVGFRVKGFGFRV